MIYDMSLVNNTSSHTIEDPRKIFIFWARMMCSVLTQSEG